MVVNFGRLHLRWGQPAPGGFFSWRCAQLRAGRERLRVGTVCSIIGIVVSSVDERT